MRNTQPSRGPVIPSRGPLHPLGTDEVRITGGFWAERQRINGAATIRHALGWMDELGWTGNFAAVGNGAGSRERKGREFSDSEVCKIIEALTSQIGGAQAADGYLSTAFGRSWQRPRYSDLAWGHELYLRRSPAAGRGGPHQERGRRAVAGHRPPRR